MEAAATVLVISLSDRCTSSLYRELKAWSRAIQMEEWYNIQTRSRAIHTNKGWYIFIIIITQSSRLHMTVSMCSYPNVAMASHHVCIVHCIHACIIKSGLLLGK